MERLAHKARKIEVKVVFSYDIHRLDGGHVLPIIYRASVPLPCRAFDLLNKTQINATGLMTAEVWRELVIIFDIFNN